ncbi:MAG: hypothetical protein DRJ31_05975 [Candidatus Methanomethylicota archaeon]|uniref:4Fe-4S ferredoxin-type domain-containing protein n=1 Tax=Thermoproteota archaeon TaxID=2056631 RepID=A0A497ENY1_9CREN|nr:MAG: hypothetical protein DRJ31_05975 [Candidatus Verstraetearchaeota archaeon]
MIVTTANCTKCYECVKVCPTKAFKIVRDLPFSCTTCGICAEVCPVKAIYRTRSGGLVVDRSRCRMCGLCVKHCPFGVAREEDGRIYGICVRCMKCIPVCPVGARVDVYSLFGRRLSYEEIMELSKPGRIEELIRAKEAVGGSSGS